MVEARPGSQGQASSMAKVQQPNEPLGPDHPKYKKVWTNLPL